MNLVCIFNRNSSRVEAICGSAFALLSRSCSGKMAGLLTSLGAVLHDLGGGLRNAGSIKFSGVR